MKAEEFYKQRSNSIRELWALSPKKIEAKVELSKVEQWSTDWNNESEKSNELKKLEWDMKMAIYERCGVDLSNISIELVVSD